MRRQVSCEGLRWRKGAPRPAFTLIELLVVASVIAMLVAILLPSLRRARHQARSTLCAGNMHQFAIAFGAYQAEHRGYQPRGGTHNSAHWILLVARQLGDRRKYAHVNQVPVERYPVFSCPERAATLPSPFIDYVVNAFHVGGRLPDTWPEVQVPQPLTQWKHPARTLLLGDAAFEGPPDRNGGANVDGVLRANRLNHPAAMRLTNPDQYDPIWHASLDRMDVWHATHLQTRTTRRAGNVTHLGSYCNWLHGDGHGEAVKWLNGKRTEKDWLRLYGVKKP